MIITLEVSDERIIDIEWNQKIPKLHEHFLFDGMLYFSYNIIWNYTIIDNIKIYKPSIIIYNK